MYRRCPEPDARAGQHREQLGQIADLLIARLAVPGPRDAGPSDQGQAPPVDLVQQLALPFAALSLGRLLGLTETDVASDLLVSLSGSSQNTLSYWIDPKTGTQYPVVAQTPQFRLASLTDLATTPVTSATGTWSPGLF